MNLGDALLPDLATLPDPLALAEQLARALDERAWAGPDPYDALRSPLCGIARSKRSRQALIQTVKRSPLNLRTLLLIPEFRTAAGTGLGALACARLSSLPEWQRRAQRLAQLTADSQLTGQYAGLWSYEFDVQTRWGYYPATLPNIVATVFAADGCLAGVVLSGEAATEVGTGLLNHLYQGEYFTYTPKSNVLIHNANLMGASLALRLADFLGGDAELGQALRRAAKRAVGVSVDCQRPDGSWPYGEGPGLSWVDGFHTAYVLTRLFETRSEVEATCQEAVDIGASFYFSRLFDDGRPLYSLTDHRRRDGNNMATALRMAVWGAEQGYVKADLSLDVYRHLLAEGWLASFLEPRPRWSARRLPSPRWVGAPLLDALTAWAGWTM